MMSKLKIFIVFFILLSIVTNAQQNTVTRKCEEISTQVDEGKLSILSGKKKLYSIQMDALQHQKVAEASAVVLYLAVLDDLEGKKEKGLSSLLKEVQIIHKFNNGLAKDTLLLMFYAQIATYHKRLGQLDSAEVYYKKAIQLASQVKKLPLHYVVLSFSNYANLKQQEGDTEEAMILLKKAITYFENNASYVGQDFVFTNLATLLIQKGDLQEAKLYIRKAIPYTENGINKGEKYLKLVDISLKTNELSEAKEMLALADKTFRGAGYVKAGAVFPWFEQRLQLAYGTYYGRTNNTAAAQKAFELVLAQNQRFYKNLKGSYAADAYLGLAALALPQEAANYCQLAAEASYKTNIEAVPKLENILSPRTFVAALAQRATYETPQKAALTYEQAMQAASQIRRSFSMPSSKFFYTERVYALYENALRAMGNQAPDKTFRFMEYSKAAVLSDVLLEQRIKLTNVSPNLLNEERQLKQQLSKLQTKEPKPEEKSKIENEIRDLQIKSGFLVQKIEKSSPAYFRLKYRTDTPKAAAIQAKLDNKTAIVSYLLTNRELFISVVTKDNIVAHVVPIDTSFHLNLAKFNRLLYSNPGLESYKGSGLSQVLYKQLILPIEPLISTKKQLIFVRDGQLNYLPFEVLEKSKGNYLLHNYYIAYNYSASLWLDNQSVKSKKNTSLLSVAPYANNSILQNPYRDRSLGALPFSENEVDKIGGDIYKNNAATKQKFMEKYRSHGLIHFATHAQIDDQDPAKSFIAFYPDSSGYKLFTEELYNLSLENTQLVVLSACEAGRGSLQKGEGLMSLARGFAYAGCPAVITTLWKAHDKSTAFLAERLHVYLKKGYTKDKALQLAKKDFLTSDIGQEFDHPYYWANFILIGDTSALYAPTPVYMYAILVAAILLLLVVGFLWYKNKRTT